MRRALLQKRYRNYGAVPMALYGDPTRVSLWAPE